MGLITNQEKNKIYDPSKLSSPYIEIGEYRFERVEKFIYLGSLLNRTIRVKKASAELYWQIDAQTIRRKTKLTLYKTLIRPVVTYCSKTWVMSKNDEKITGAFERKILRKFYGPINEHGLWRRRYNFELYKLFSNIGKI
ncbi:hypothetical protein J437_LFUL017182 [Ladona fulva]|uniref:Uncharacterized protein n=1 Tax=Ladona fulva TaxID=123851 RepID=A0A8K0KM06_LADFU|nr:hypothetical protein J437_LFUL017182 [Ladona fulva]